MTAEQYAKIRDAEEKKKASNYDYNVKKAGKFLGYDEFYMKRGTEVGGSWMKAPGKGHRFAKTKYDWGGQDLPTKGWKDAVGSVLNTGKKAPKK